MSMPDLHLLLEVYEIFYYLYQNLAETLIIFIVLVETIAPSLSITLMLSTRGY